jgi:hypothetical protein
MLRFVARGSEAGTGIAEKGLVGALSVFFNQEAMQRRFAFTVHLLRDVLLPIRP